MNILLLYNHAPTIKSVCIISLLCLVVSSINSQSGKKEKTPKGTIYFALGSHRIFFTPSTIHVNRTANPQYNFTLEKVKGRDEGGLIFKTAPQFSYTLGYYFKNKNWGIEYQYDHIKYYVKQNQVVRMHGTIGNKEYNTDTLITPDFFKFEHTDGGNYAMINVVKWLPLSSKEHKWYVPDLMIKGGFGLVNPKTSSTILGNYRDDRYHLSGYVVGFESGFRFTPVKHLFVTGTFKGVFANYNDILIAGGRASQKWFSGQFNYMIGGQIPL